MMRSLYSGVSGLKTHQTKMDVIGNNIANVNTTAYKSQSVTFSELMYQTTQSASGANAASGVGGTNARQIGLGVKSGAINTNISAQGSTQSTGNAWDIAITGDAFFVVSNGGENFFTRDGSFYVDGVGNLCMTSTGYTVMGWQYDETENTIKQDTVSALKIMTADNMTYPPEATTKATVSGVIDKEDSNVNTTGGKVVSLEFYDNQGYKYTAKFSVHALDGDDGEFYIKLDDITDSSGNSIGGNMSDYFGGDITDANGDTVSAAMTLTYTTGTGKFDGIGSSGTSTATLSLDSLANFQNITLDFSATSNYANGKTSTIGMVTGDEDGNGTGRKIGEMSGISVAKDGIITATYDNGQSRTLGQIAVATFANASGLAKEGDNLYSSTMNSGEFDGVGEDITAGGGYLSTGVLEMSNVDLAGEFTEMITTQRGFQANSRIITVSDTMLEELTNLKR